MKIFDFIKTLGGTSFLFLTLFFFPQQEGFTQKNAIKITPIKIEFGKVNVSYERKINKTWSLIVDAQHWFIKGKEVDEKSLIKIDFGFSSKGRPPILGTNKGTRFSLGLRGYTLLKGSGNIKRKFYFGSGGFVGKHDISMERKSYSYTETDGGFWGDGQTTTVSVPRLNGEVDLISGGVYFDSGIKFIFLERMNLELGFIGGRAWTNKVDDYLTLFDHSPYNLEPETNAINKEYENSISGVFIKPMFSLGVEF